MCSRHVLPTAKLLLWERCRLQTRVPVRPSRAAQLALRQQRRRWIGTAAVPPPPPAPAAAAAAATASPEAAAGGSVLFLSPVWPERSSSAAGVRTSDLLAAFQQRGWRAAYASSSSPNEHTAALAAAGVATFQCLANREAQLAQVLAQVQPAAVVFDRFYCEEAFSFRVRELAPQALRVLDMQDMHALRAERQRLAEAGAPAEQVLACRPDATSPDCLRELAAIHRSDLTLVCSPAEMQLLAQHYGVPSSKLALAPFFAPPSPHAAAGGGPGFVERRHFVMIGNWRHPPNLDSARWACSEVWPALRAALPREHRDAELHLYGAYPAGAAQQLHRPKAGVHMKGFAPRLDMMLGYRVLLAPLRYGAGLKGKVVESWWRGLPVVTTPIGAEGMGSADADPGDLTADQLAARGAQPPALPADPAADGYVWQQGDPRSSSSGGGGVNAAGQPQQQQQQQGWGGLCGGTTAEGIAGAAALLYSDQQLWEACQARGFQLLRLLYDGERNLERVQQAVAAATGDLEERRRLDFAGAMLWQQSCRSTEFFSRWIELKEGLRNEKEGREQEQEGAAAAVAVGVEPAATTDGA